MHLRPQRVPGDRIHHVSPLGLRSREPVARPQHQAPSRRAEHRLGTPAGGQNRLDGDAGPDAGVREQHDEVFRANVAGLAGVVLLDGRGLAADAAEARVDARGPSVRPELTTGCRSAPTGRRAVTVATDLSAMPTGSTQLRAALVASIASGNEIGKESVA